MYRDVGVSKLKGEAYSNFRLPYSDEGAVCMFCEDYPPEIFTQLTVEEYVPAVVAGKVIGTATTSATRQ
jgi:hypothetical protein